MNDLTTITSMGTIIAKSNLFGIKTPEQAMALMLIAQAQNRHPATVATEYDIIQGRPALRSQAALMRFQEAGGKIEYVTRTDKMVEANFSHPQGGSLTVSWTMDRAAKMGLSKKDNWVKQPMIMLQWRVVAEGVRACYPACLGGCYLVEEVQDFDPPKPALREPQPIQVQAVQVDPEPEPEKMKFSDRVSRALEYFAKKGISEAMILEKLKIKKKSHISAEHLVTLKEIGETAKIGKTTLEAEFNVITHEPQPAAQAPAQGQETDNGQSDTTGDQEPASEVPQNASGEVALFGDEDDDADLFTRGVA